jgi:hypothetical protein
MTGHDLTLLMVYQTNFLNLVGGTEVYFRNVAEEVPFGYASSVAPPGRKNWHYNHHGLAVYRFRPDDRPRVWRLA